MKSKGTYYVYIAQCSDRSLYTGLTKNPALRLRQHNGEIKGGAVYTSGRRPVRYVLIEEHADFHSAAVRERDIKSLNKKQKLKLIELKCTDNFLRNHKLTDKYCNRKQSQKS